MPSLFRFLYVQRVISGKDMRRTWAAPSAMHSGIRGTLLCDALTVSFSVCTAGFGKGYATYLGITIGYAYRVLAKGAV